MQGSDKLPSISYKRDPLCPWGGQVWANWALGCPAHQNAGRIIWEKERRLERSATSFAHCEGIGAFGFVCGRTEVHDATVPAPRTALVFEHQFNTGTCSA